MRKRNYLRIIIPALIIILIVLISFFILKWAALFSYGEKDIGRILLII